MKKETAVSCKTAGEVPEEVSIYNTIIPQPALEDSSCARHTRLLDTFSIEKHDSRSSCTLMGREWSSAPPGLSPGLQVYPQTDTLLNIYLIKKDSLSAWGYSWQLQTTSGAGHRESLP